MKYSFYPGCTLEGGEENYGKSTEAVCHASEREAIQRYLLNPNIEVTPLQLPPRRSRDDAACRWEFKLRG